MKRYIGIIDQKFGANTVSKLKYANNQAAAIEINIPVRVEILPKKKYSIRLILKICFLLAPMVLSKTASFIR